ncbi:MAG: glycosyltransferase family 4 protein [Eubacterium sp.]|nr:glycosyltransferase family 4 protein [Eubacterium sp.]
MKIAITTIQAPFVSGGAEFLAENLKQALIQEKHEAEIVTIPFMDSTPEMIENHIIASRLFALGQSWAGNIDLNIALKFPAYYIPHPNKVVWALHQHRAAYDLFDTEYSNLKDNPDGNYIRKVISNADCCYLPEAKRIYTIAENVKKRMQKYNNIHARTLYHPCPDMEKFYCKDYQNYILMPSRINITKRQMLALEAMCHTKSDIQLYIVGKADNVLERTKMLDFIKKQKLQKKVRYFDFVTQEQKFELYANAKAVLFIPLDEDYGYITLEAMAASKAVITAKDSGGPLEFVIDNKTGFVAEADAKAIAEKIDELADSDAQAAEMGKKAKKHLMQMDISWANVVKELTKP